MIELRRINRFDHFSTECFLDGGEALIGELDVDGRHVVVIIDYRGLSLILPGKKEVSRPPEADIVNILYQLEAYMTKTEFLEIMSNYARWPDL